MDLLEVKINGILDETKTLQDLLAIIDSDAVVELIKTTLEVTPKRIVYTSFDGDYLDYINHMAYITLKAGFTPINPECALGYYVSTHTHGGEKTDTMQDCIALELLCDELWLFLENPSDFNSFPEGVVAEMISWIENKETSAMRVYSDEMIKAFTTLTTISGDIEKKKDILSSEFEFFELNIQNMLEEIDSHFISDIRNRLTNKIKTRRREVIYASTNFFDIKYSDWLRAYCYRNGKVAIVPSQLLNSFVLNAVYGDSIIQEYLIDRLSLLKKVDNIYFITKPRNKSNTYSIDFIFDYAFWLVNKDQYSVEFLTWDQMDVPKFVNRNWALTRKENKEYFDNEK